MSQYLNSSSNLVVVHVGGDGVHVLLVGEDIDPGVADDVSDVADQDGEDEDAHQPRGRHEEDLGDVGRLLVLADRRRGLRREVEASEMCFYFIFWG